MKLTLIFALFMFNIYAEKPHKKPGIEPDVIRKVLIDHIPQFRYCLQKEMDKSKDAIEFMPTFRFVIGKKGTVVKSKVDTGKGPHSKHVKNVQACAGKVLRALKFPKPSDGGTVEVNQPMNFYPRKN